MLVYYAGLNASPLFLNDTEVTVILDRFTEVPFPGITDMEIGWNYFLLWQGTKLYITGKVDDENINRKGIPLSVEVPETSSARIKCAVTGREQIVLLMTNNDIWRYKIYEKSWKKVPRFIPNNGNMEFEFITKIAQGGCTVALTNLGRVFNIPTLVDMPKRVKFVDVACGFDHTILLAENGDTYSMGIGTRGQLGHGDLNDSDNPKLIKALAGLKVVQISAAGWHSAAVTDQGDLYTWGWNTSGELGIVTNETKVVPTPTPVDFKDKDGEPVEINVKKVQCGNVFTICLMDDGSLWGSGSNKYGQLGQPQVKCPDLSIFSRLNIPLDSKCIKNFKCREWGTIILIE